MIRRLVGAALTIMCVTSPDPAFAYRPFDGTDAAVADAGEVEIEFGPLEYVVEPDGRTFVVPAFVVNWGFAERWEFVVEGKNLFERPVGEPTSRRAWDDTALLVKTLVRPGTLQNARGPGIAVEFGVLLPTPDRPVGSVVTATVSQRWSGILLHLNEAIGMTRDGEVATESGVIVEGPSGWPVRPVCEFVYAFEDAGRDASALLGAIWNVNERVSFDAGWRVRIAGGAPTREVRAGLTWAFPLQ